jgi:hypothetical protein
VSSLPSRDVHSRLALGTMVQGEIIGYDDPNSDARYVHLTRFISGPLWKQEVPELGYWQYGVQRAAAEPGHSAGVVMVDPDTVKVVETKRVLRARS